MFARVNFVALIFLTRKASLLFLSIALIVMVSQPPTMLLGDESYSPRQLAAARLLLIANSRPADTPGIRRCGLLPGPGQLLDALKYSPDDRLVGVPDLPFGLTSLPAEPLRFSYCVPSRPPEAQTRQRLSWLHGFESRVYGNSSVNILGPTGSGPSHPPITLHIIKDNP